MYIHDAGLILFTVSTWFAIRRYHKRLEPLKWSDFSRSKVTSLRSLEVKARIPMFKVSSYKQKRKKYMHKNPFFLCSLLQTIEFLYSLSHWHFEHLLVFCIPSFSFILSLNKNSLNDHVRGAHSSTDNLMLVNIKKR